MDGELKPETILSQEPPVGFEQSVQQSLKEDEQQFEEETPRTVMTAVEAFTRGSRDVARKFANNKFVKWFPIVSPLINASLDMQKASIAVTQGKDIDTGVVLSGKEQAKMAVSKYGTALWEQMKAGVDVAFLAIGGSVVEKIGLKSVPVIGEVFAQGINRLPPKIIWGAGDTLIYGIKGREGGNLKKIEVAESVVKSMPGMYKSAAKEATDPDSKRLLLEASKMFKTVSHNRDTRRALAESLAKSPRINEVMAQMHTLNGNKEDMDKLYMKIGTEFMRVSHKHAKNW